MARFQSTFEVGVDALRASQYLSDATRAPEWDPSVVSAELLDPPGDPDGVGRRTRLVLGFYGRRFEVDDVLEQHQPGRRVVRRGAGAKLRRCDTFVIEPLGDAARVTYELELTLKGVLRAFDKGLRVTLESMGGRAAEQLGRTLTPSP